MPYRVSSSMGGKRRVITDKTFRTKAKAEAYAREHSKYYKGSNPKVIPVRPKKRRK